MASNYRHARQSANTATETQDIGIKGDAALNKLTTNILTAMGLSGAIITSGVEASGMSIVSRNAPDPGYGPGPGYSQGYGYGPGARLRAWHR